MPPGSDALVQKSCHGNCVKGSLLKMTIAQAHKGRTLEGIELAKWMIASAPP